MPDIQTHSAPASGSASTPAADQRSIIARDLAFCQSTSAELVARLSRPGQFLIRKLPSGELQICHLSERNGILYTQVQRDANGLFIHRWRGALAHGGRPTHYANETRLRNDISARVGLQDMTRPQDLLSNVPVRRPLEKFFTPKSSAEIVARLKEFGTGSYLLYQPLPGTIELWHHSSSGEVLTTPITRDEQGFYSINRWQNRLRPPYASLEALHQALSQILAQNVAVFTHWEKALEQWQYDAPEVEIDDRQRVALEVRTTRRDLNKTLQINGLDNLSSLPPVLPDGFEHIKIDACPNLLILPALPQRVTEIKLSGSTALTAIPALPPGLSTLDIIGSPALSALPPLPESLTRLTLRDTPRVTELPDLPYDLTSLELSGNQSLTRLPPMPESLTHVKLKGCAALTRLPSFSFRLQVLDLSGCSALTRLPPLPESTSRSSSGLMINLSGCGALTEVASLPSYVTSLYLNDCGALPSLLALPRYLRTLDLSGCHALTQLPTLPQNVRTLNLSGCAALTRLPALPANLYELNLAGCHSLTALPPLPNLARLNLSGCSSLTRLENLPQSLWSESVSSTHARIGWLTSLNLSGCSALTRLPPLSPNLTELDLSGCTRLTTLPELPPRLRVLNLSGCRLDSLPTLPAGLIRLDLSNTTLASWPTGAWPANLQVITTNAQLPAHRPLPQARAGSVATPRVDPTLPPIEQWLQRAGNSEEKLTQLRQGWPALRDEPGGAHFETLLNRLNELEIFSDLEQDLGRMVDPEQVAAVIHEALRDPDSRAVIFEASEGAADNCHDRPLMIFNNIQAQAKFSRLVREQAGDGALFDLASGMFKRALLDEAVPALMNKQWQEGRRHGALLSEASIAHLDTLNYQVETADNGSNTTHARQELEQLRRRVAAAGENQPRTAATLQLLDQFQRGLTASNGGLDKAAALPALNALRKRLFDHGVGPNNSEALEVQLALRQRLARELDLPFTVRALYAAGAGLNLSDVTFTRDQVLRTFSEPGRLAAGLLAQPMWKSHLAQRLANELSIAAAPFDEPMNQLFEQKDNLSDHEYKTRIEAIQSVRNTAIDRVLIKHGESIIATQRLTRFGERYHQQLTQLQQRVRNYLAQHPNSARAPALSAFATQLNQRATELSTVANAAPAERQRLLLQLEQGASALPSAAALKQHATVLGMVRDTEYRAILHDLEALHAQRLPPLSALAAPSAPRQERLLSWDQVRDRVAPAFAEQGRQLAASVRQAPQAIWLDSDPADARRGRCAGLAQAWAWRPDATPLLDNLFSAAAQPEDPATLQFRHDIDQLHQNQSALNALNGVDSWRQAIAHLAVGVAPRSLLIDVGNHRVALAAEGSGDTLRYRFFDPNAGEWSALSAGPALAAALDAHFTPEMRRQYGFDGRIRAFAVAPPPEDSASHSVWRRVNQPLRLISEQLARQDQVQGPIQLGNERVTRQELFQIGATVGDQKIRADTDWSEPSRIRLPAKPVGLGSGAPAASASVRAQGVMLASGSGMRLYGVYSNVRSVVDNFKRGQTQAAAIDLGSLGSEFAGEALERGAARLGAFLQTSLSRAGSLVARVGLSAGRLLARGAGVVGNIVTLPFDLYTAITSFSASHTKTGLERQDLLFSGGMASLGAAVGISLAIAAAAGAGALAGPIGLVFGAAMIAASQLYSAIRQVQEVEQWVTLSAGERFELGWYSFLGRGIDHATEMRMLAAQGDQLARQQVETQAQALLAAPKPTLGAVLTPTPSTVARLLKHVSSSDHAHRHLVEQADSNVSLEPGWFDAWAETSTPAGRNALARRQNHPPKPERYEVFVQASNDDLDVERDRAAAGVIWQSNGRDDLPVQINLGDGNDRLVGSRARANRVQLGSGNKTVIGGAQDDIVSLDATPAWMAAAGVSLHDRYDLDGAAGSDTLALETDFAEQTARGYRVDLAAQTLDLIERDGRFTPLGAVRHFEHLLHARGAGAHQLYGDAGNNTLSGNGRDRLYGRGGNDLLRVAGSVFADGGDGDDVYLVSALAAGDQVTLQDSGQTRAEAPGRSVVYLDFALEQISDWRVEGHDLVLTIASGARVTVKDVYQTQDGQRGLRSGHWAFATRDGFTLAPQLPVTLSDAQDASDFMIDALYVPAADRSRADTQGGVELDLAARRVAHRAPPLQRKRATDSPADQPMAGGLQLGPRYRLSGSGGDQADIVRGTAGDDVLRAGRGYDRLIGNGGSDVFVIEAEPGAVEIDTRAPAGATPGAQNALVLASLLGRAELSISGDDVLIRAEMPPASARAAPPTRTIRHLGGARAERPAPLFIIDAQGSQLHWQVEHNADGQATIAHYTQIAGSVGCALGARAGARNLLLGGAGADTLFAQSPGQLLRGGDGADRYIVDWMPATDADSEAYLIDNQAEDGALDTLEIRTTLPPGHFALARINDDLAITERLPGTEAHAEQRVAAMILVDYYRAGAQRHLALELSAEDGMITQRIEADELEQLALDPEIARLTPAPSAALARLLQASAGFGAAGGADLSAAQTTAMIAPQALLAAV